MLVRSIFFALLVSVVVCLNVTFDNRAFLLDGKRTLFIGGSIHYPRAHSAEWPRILQEAKANGINLVQTYVFWDIHEPKEGEYYFPSDGSSDDLVAFIQACEAEGLYVNLRFGPYVCAEWNYGGFPAWLRQVKDVQFRTMNDPFLERMSAFVDKTLQVVQDARLLANDGGPIVMLQIENEYGNMQKYYPRYGDDYVQWAASYALGKNLSVPWIMCQQGEGTGTAPPANVINTCNGYYCDNWIEQHARDFPNQPHMWTENWPGWFQNWGDAVPHRPAVDVAFAVARWYARGGTFQNYYMAFGGTTFGRQVGGPEIITSYDYDVQINEYGLRAEPKFSLLAQLHAALTQTAPVILSHDTVPAAVPLPGSSSCDSITYDDSRYQSELGCVAFLSNIGTEGACTFDIHGVSVEVPAWSVSVVARACPSTAGGAAVLMNTRTSAAATAKNKIGTKQLVALEQGAFESWSEPIPATHSAPVLSAHPPDQLALTLDATDYLWLSSALPARARAGDARLTFRVGDAGGAVCYAYIDGQLAASTIDTSRPATKGQHAAGTQATPYTTEVAARSGRREHREVLAEGETETLVTDKSRGTPVSLTVTLPAGRGSGSRLDLLFASTGIQNYGPYLERLQVGVISDIRLDGAALSNYSTVAGLNGEQQQQRVQRQGARPLMPGPPSDLLPFTATAADAEADATRPLTWHRARFETPTGVVTQGEGAITLALDLSGTSLVKGALWVNNFMLGRYWNILAGTENGDCNDAAECTEEAYTGGYDAVRCRTGCGALSQALYKLPAALLHPAGSGRLNTVVLLEEAGGSPAGLRLQQVFMTAAEDVSE